MFNVPKKVNRHVFKAMNILSGGNIRKRLSTAVILKQVVFQMRNLVPVTNVDKVVQKSLMKLSDYGLINRVGPNRFSIAQTYEPAATHPQSPNAADRSVLRPTGSRKRSASDLDRYKSRHREPSQSSLSDDEYGATRKRMHSNNSKLRRTGKSVVLPKTRQHLQYPLFYARESSSCVPGYDNNIFGLDNNLVFVSQPSDTHLEPVHRLNISNSLTNFNPASFPQIHGIAEPHLESASCANIQLTETSKSATDFDSTKDQNTTLNEQTEMLPVSRSFVAEPTEPIDTENGMSATSPESSNIET